MKPFNKNSFNKNYKKKHDKSPNQPHEKSHDHKTIIIYGRHASIDCIKNPKRIIYEILVSEKNLEDIKEVILKHNPSLIDKIKITENKHLDNLLGEESTHQGYAVIAKPLAYINLHDVLKSLKDVEKQTFLILDQVKDTRNIGSIIRTAVAFDVNGIIFPNTNAPKETAQMVKAAAGGIEKINLIEVSNIQNTIETLKKEGFWIIGLDTNTSTSLNKIDPFNKTVLVLGSEESGMRQLTKKCCDFIAKIPMNTNLMESLNISNATAIALYELYQKKE